jgi:hypothetical protein
MARTIRYSTEAHVDRIDAVLARRASKAGPQASRTRPRGGRQGARVALRRELAVAR